MISRPALPLIVPGHRQSWTEGSDTAHLLDRLNRATMLAAATPSSASPTAIHTQSGPSSTFSAFSAAGIDAKVGGRHLVSDGGAGASAGPIRTDASQWPSPGAATSTTTRQV